MTHDELIRYLTRTDYPQFSRAHNAEIADRLDRYREIISRCERRMPLDSCSAPDDVRELLRDIAEALR